MSQKGNNKKWLRLIVLVLPLISLINSVLPAATKKIIQKILGRVRDYKIDIGSIHIRWGFLQLKNFSCSTLVNGQAGGPPFSLNIKSVELAFNPKSLWKGIIQCQALIDSPVCSFSKGPIKQGGSGSASNIPFSLEYATIFNGILEFTDTQVVPAVDIKATGIDIACYNLTNMQTGELLPTKVEAKAKVCDGTMNARVSLNAFEDSPTFDLNAEIKDVDLVLLNDFFEAYGGFKVNCGTFDIFTEAAAKESKFKGYAKALIQDLDMDDDKAKADGLRARLKSSLIEAFAWIFENPVKDQLGTKIPFGGTFKNPKVNIFYAIIETFYNGFISALKPTLDHKIDINSIKGK